MFDRWLDGRVHAASPDAMSAHEPRSRAFRRLDTNTLAQLGSWVWDIGANVITWSDELYRILGISPSAFDHTYETAMEFCHPDDRSRLDALIARAIEGNEPYTCEHRLVRADGAVRVVQSRGTLVVDYDGRRRLVGVVQDVTERRHAEDELHRQKEIFQKTFDHMPVMLAVLSADWRVELWNGQVQRTLGWSHDEARDHFLDVLAESYPDARERRRVLQFIRETNGEWADFKTRTKAGRVVGTTWVVAVLSDGTRICIGQDITERKRYEEELQRSEAQLTAAQRLASVGDWKWTFDGGALVWSAETYRIFGVDPGTFALTYAAFLSCVHPDDRERVIANLDRAVARRESLEHEFRIVRPNGDVRVLHSRSEIHQDDEGRPVMMVGMSQDVTERTLAEESLRHQLDFTEAITASLGEGVYTFDHEGRVTLVNRAGERDLGWTAAEVVGRDVHALLHAGGARHPRERCALPRVLASGVTITVDSDTFTRRDGSSIPVAYTSSPIVTDGRVVGAVLAFRDITEQKRVEAMRRTFAQRLIETQEAERRRVAHELHDEIGQALTAIKINLAATRPASGVASSQLNESSALVDQALQRVRDLSFNLRPSLLDDLGLLAALRCYVDHEARRAGLTPHFLIDVSAGRVAAAIETACFRVAQEALTNVVRHARARNVWVQLHKNAGALHLFLRDDGAGFDAAAACRDWVSDRHLGLRGMQERVRILEGDIDIASTIGRGTTVHACFPLTHTRPPRT
jgi:PAS domain S-box-containing protein